MTKIDLSELNIRKVHELLQNRDLSACELLEFCGENAKKHEKNVHAYLELFDDAYEQAKQVDEEIKKGKELPLLAGIPVGIKDNILIKDKKCSAGSKILENFTASYDATVVKKLKENGAISVGRTNMDEFAMGASTEHSAFGPTRNPHDLERVPGGSSGGSAVAVAQQMCLFALGSDTGGSVRQPAGFCGVVGLKPTYGAVSRFGLIALASSLDQIGPLTKTVEDTEIVFNVIKGEDPLDSTSVESKIRSRKKRDEIRNLTIGVLKSGHDEFIHKDVATAVDKAVDVFKNLGCEIKEIKIPSLDYSTEVYYIIMSAEASSNLARYDGVRYGLSEKGDDLLGDYMRTREKGFGDEPRRRILLGTYVLSTGYYDAYYNQAQKVRSLMKDEFRKTFDNVDIILSPTASTPAFKIGEKTENPVEMYLADVFTCSANLAGLPAISIPAGFSGKLPVAIQLIAPWFEEERLFYLGKLFEQNS